MPITDCDLVACYDDSKPSGMAPLWVSVIAAGCVGSVLIMFLAGVAKLIFDLVA